MPSRTLFVDPTPSLEPESPGTRGVVVSASAGAAVVTFRGRSVSCAVPGGVTLSAGAQCNVVILGDSVWAIPAEYGLPSSFKVDAAEWRRRGKDASLAMLMLMRRNPPLLRYRSATALSVAGSTATVKMPDGRTLTLPVMAGAAPGTIAAGTCLVKSEKGGRVFVVGDTLFVFYEGNEHLDYAGIMIRLAPLDPAPDEIGTTSTYPAIYYLSWEQVVSLFPLSWVGLVALHDFDPETEATKFSVTDTREIPAEPEIPSAFVRPTIEEVSVQIGYPDGDGVFQFPNWETRVIPASFPTITHQRVGFKIPSGKANHGLVRVGGMLCSDAVPMRSELGVNWGETWNPWSGFGYTSDTDVGYSGFYWVARFDLVLLYSDGYYILWDYPQYGTPGASLDLSDCGGPGQPPASGPYHASNYGFLTPFFMVMQLGSWRPMFEWSSAPAGYDTSLVGFWAAKDGCTIPYAGYGGWRSLEGSSAPMNILTIPGKDLDVIERTRETPGAALLPEDTRPSSPASSYPWIGESVFASDGDRRIVWQSATPPR